MANDTTNNPWVIDTASGNAITADRVRVGVLRWVGATAAGHQLRVKNAAGKVVHESFANGANFIDEQTYGNARGGFHGEGIDVDGLIVDVLGSGKLYVYLK